MRGATDSDQLARALDAHHAADHDAAHLALAEARGWLPPDTDP